MPNPERTEKGLLREIVHRGETMRERVTYDSGRSMTFVRETGTERGTITNQILDDPTDGLVLRFAFKLEVEGIKAGSREEKEFAAGMEKDYLTGVKTTVMQIRKLVREGALRQQPAVPDWVQAHYRDVDALDAEKVAAWFTDDGTVVFANHPPAVGRSAIEAAVGAFMSSIRGMRHEFSNVWELGATTVFEARVTYTRTDGATVAIPAATFLERCGDKIASCRIYVDHAALARLMDGRAPQWRAFRGVGAPVPGAPSTIWLPRHSANSMWAPWPIHRSEGPFAG